MAKFDQTICLEQAVESVEKQADGVFKLVTNSETHYSKRSLSPRERRI